MNPVNTKPYHLPEDAVWLITGCSSGIGRALAELVASHPSQTLIATARDPAALAYLPTDRANVLRLALDVTSPASVEAAFAAAAEHLNNNKSDKNKGKGWRLDVVVNNAGYELQGDTEAVGEAQARDQLETVFFGTARVATRAVAVMRETAERKGGGVPPAGLVVNVSSLAGLCAFAGQSYYHAAKFAVEGFTESFAREMHPSWNINFCLVEPAGVKTNFEKSSKKTVAPHPAYAAPDMPTRQIIAMVTQARASGAGMEPAAVAAAVYGVASRGERVPLHLPLSLTAYGLIKKKAEGLLRELEDVKAITAMGQAPPSS
ncbi:short-chain dehydrogenase/reductase-like protein SDR [Xylariaceae sp. FL0804]|nr:short-chain dehydrogenase/reductase-like protein SDR [Xylariaceae sp. FL0804]